MVLPSDKILDLGDYKSFSLERSLKEKMDTSVLDAGGLYSPLSVSLVIPTKFGTEKEREVELEALKKILSECSELVDAGYLDEIIVIDATRDKNGNPDFRVLQNVVEVAYEKIGLFREQVKLLAKYGSENQKGKRGLRDFVIKVVHQFDENLPKVLAKFGVFGVTGFFGIPPGKGAGLWLAIPLTAGDVICFIDSDILNFKKEFVIALCHPIIYSWNLREAAIKFVKAYYTRLTKVPSLPTNEAILGGRVCRFFAIPLLRAVTETLGIYEPLTGFKYPLAGEFALSRDVIETLHLPSEYSIETYLLFQLQNEIGNTAMAQVNLKVFHHLGQSISQLENMARQVGTSIIERVNEKRQKPLTVKEKKLILQRYRCYLKQMIRKAKVEPDMKECTDTEISKVVYIEEDEKSLQPFIKVVEEILNYKVKEKRTILPSWSQIREKTGNYFILSEILRRRSNQSTWARLNEVGLLSRSKEE